MKYRLRHSKTTLQQRKRLFFFIYPHNLECKHSACCRTRSEHRESNSDCYEVNRVSDTVSVRTCAPGAQHLRVHRRQNEKCAAVYNTAYGTHKQPCNSSARCLFFIYPLISVCKHPACCRTRSEHRKRNSDCYEVNRVSDTVSVRTCAPGAQHLRVHRRQNEE